MTRLVLPTVILLAAASLLAYSARGAFIRAMSVQVVPVLVKGIPQDAPSNAATGGGDALATRAAPGGAVVAQAPGWVEAAPYPVNVPALADGVVREVLVLEGERVEANQVVARLIDDDARLAARMAQADVAERQAAVDAATAALEGAQSEWDNPVERTRAVAAAEAMLAEAEAELAQVPAEVREKQAMADEAADELARKGRLLEIGGVSEAELTRLRLRVQSLEAAAEAARQGEGVMRARVDLARADAKAARDSLRLRISEQAELARARASLTETRAAAARAGVSAEEADLRLSRMEVRTPMSGIVLERLAEPGTRLMSGGLEANGANVVRLFDPARLQVRSDVAIADGARIGAGQPAQIVVDVLPDRTFSGTVTRLVGQANIQKNTIQAKVAIDDPDEMLRPEMLARVKFLSAGWATQTAGGGRGPAAGGAERSGNGSVRLLAPRELLVDVDGDHAAGWVVDQVRSKATKRRLVLGAAADDGWVEVVEGLRPGDLLIAPLPGLKEGSKVKITSEAVLGGGAS
ncbi:MAG: efflux RND transporter periplasmic adaptor subunit [Phycisphaerales bacterium]|nr:efflux RND transporter periplasmic adaptor subunit [Phycisphaerales bacterium]